MGTVINATGFVGATAIALYFAYMLHMKIYHPREHAGRHRTDSVERVPADYIPSNNYDDDGSLLVEHTEMWRARMSRTAKALIVPVWQLEECYQEHLKDRLSNYGWAKVPTDEWPLAWRMGQ